jgi:hypothetical protein
MSAGAPVDFGYFDRVAGDKSLITAVQQETFEPLHTGKSLVFTIAPNGHVWGKRLDVKSHGGDLELEIFAPYETMCFAKLLRWADGKVRLDKALTSEHITNEQKKKVYMILAQKEQIEKMLPNLFLYRSYNMPCDFKREPESRTLLEWPQIAVSIKVIREPFGLSFERSAAGLFGFQYDGQFTLVAEKHMRFCREVHRVGQEIHARYANSIEVGSFQISTFVARNGMFHQLSGSGIGRRIWRVMDGEHNIFDRYDIDDALLLLEYEKESHMSHWTLVPVQDMELREMVRKLSNNPSLASWATKLAGDSGMKGETV